MDIIDFEFYKFMIASKYRSNPLVTNISYLLNDTMNEIFIYENSEEERELLYLLETNFVLKSLVTTHDQIANKLYEPRLSPVPYEVDEDDVNLKVCTLYKSVKEPLGTTIKPNNGNNCLSKVAISRILKGSCVDRSQLLKPGDQILEVNGVNTRYSKPEDVLPLLINSNGVLKIVIEESLEEDVGYQKDKPNDLLYARVLFNYKPKIDKQQPCKDASIELKLGDIVEICDYSQDYCHEEWWQGRLLSSFYQNYSTSLRAIVNVLNSCNKNNENAAFLIPSKLRQIINDNDRFRSEFKNIDLNVNFKIEKDESGTNDKIVPVVYEELCIFDPIIQYQHKRPIAFFFAIDNKLVSSFKCNSFSYESNQIIENLNQFTEFILKLTKYSNNEIILPDLFSVKPSIHGTPLLITKNSKNSLFQNPILKLCENSTKYYLNKAEWDCEYTKSNIESSVFDDTIGYRLIEIWLDFLTKNQQLIIFPSFENFQYFRNSTPFGKMCFNVLIDFNSDLVNQSPKATRLKRNKKTFFRPAKYLLNNIKHLFDAFHETKSQPLDEILSQIKTYIDKINHIPSFVIK